MLTPFVLLFGLTVATAVIAYWSDNLGKKLGKKRVSLFGLRPRTTATLLTIASSWGIMLFTLAVLLIMWSPLRNALLRYDRERRQNIQLRQSTRQLETEVQKQEDAVRESEGRLRSAEARLTGARAELFDIRADLAGTRTSLQRAREGEKDANRQARAAKQQGREANALLRNARSELASTRSGLTDVRQKYASAAEQLAAEKERLQDVEEGLAVARKGRAEAQQQYVEAEQAKKRALNTAKRASAEALKAARESLVVERNLSAARVNLEQSEQELKARQQEAERLRLEIQNLSAEVQYYQTAASKYRDFASDIAFGQIRLANGRTIAERMLEPRQSLESARQNLRELLAEGSTNVTALAAPDAKLSLYPLTVQEGSNTRVLTPDEIVEEAAKFISRREQPLSVRLVAAGNFLVDEKDIQTRFVVVPSVPQFTAGAEIVSGTIDGRLGDAKIFNALLNLVEQGRDVAESKGIRPPQSPQSPDFYAAGTNERLFEALRRISTAKAPVPVKIVAAENLTTAEPLRVRFELG